jgi:putative transcriptional regulator
MLDRRLGSRSLEIPVKSKLRDLRQQRSWSQADLAEQLKVSRQTVNAIEMEKYDPSLPLAFKIAKLFRLKIEDVFEDGV